MIHLFSSLSLIRQYFHKLGVKECVNLPSFFREIALIEFVARVKDIKGGEIGLVGQHVQMID